MTNIKGSSMYKELLPIFKHEKTPVSSYQAVFQLHNIQTCWKASSATQNHVSELPV